MLKISYFSKIFLLKHNIIMLKLINKNKCSISFRNYWKKKFKKLLILKTIF